MTLNEQVTAINMAATARKHDGIARAAVLSGNHARQMAGLRTMGLAPTANNLRIVLANIAREEDTK